MSLPQLVEVTVEQGVLRGQRILSQDSGQHCDVFRGIPYAQKPVGPLRFKGPRPPEPWEGARPALDEGPKALQQDMMIGFKMAGKEDCLYLNVYTPQVPSSVASRSPEFRAGAPWPIMVWVHPGGFSNGSSSATEYGPELLVAKDVVVVTVTYRLGAFGFLSLESSAAPGNYGLKDVLAALRWVKKNGGVFGGNVDQVTLFGCSAGGAATQLLRMTPSSKGLFHRAIAQSGSSLNPWAVSLRARDRAIRLAKQLGATQNDLADDKHIMDFLRSQPPEAIIDATTKIFVPEDYYCGLTLMFLPTVDGGLTPDDPEEEILFEAHPRDLLKQGKMLDIPLMTGVADFEGLLVDFPSGPSEHLVKAVPETFEKYDQNLEIAIPFELKKEFPDGSEKAKKAGDRIRQVYFNGGAVSEATRIGFYNLQSDLLFATGVLQEAKAHAKLCSSPVYVYCFGVKGKLNRLLPLTGKTYENTPGACHGDELGYLFTGLPPLQKIPLLDPQCLEAQTRHRLVTLWTNFAKFGNPTPDGESTLEGIRWPALPKDVESSLPYLDIAVALNVPRAGIFQERVELWNSLYAEMK